MSTLKDIALTACTLDSLPREERELARYKRNPLTGSYPVREWSDIYMTFTHLIVNGHEVGTIDGSAVTVGGVTFDRGDECESASEALDVLFALALQRMSAGAEDKDDKEERTNLAGMEHGVEAYNEAMGYDLTPGIPCGHHCYGTGCPCMDDDHWFRDEG